MGFGIHSCRVPPTASPLEAGFTAGVFHGIKPAVAAIVAQAVHRIGGRALRGGAPWAIAIAVASFVAIFALGVRFPAIVLGAALAGYLGGRVASGRFAAAGSGQILRAGPHR